MKLTVNTQDLNDALSVVIRAISARPAKQILEGVLLDAVDGNLRLCASDGNLSIESTIVADIEDSGRTVMPGKLLAEMCRKMNGGSVKFDVAANNKASIRSGSSQFSLMGMNAMEFPEMPEVEDGQQINIQQNRLREMISKVVFSIATDETRQILTGCLLEITPDEARMIALDGYRLAMQRLFQPFSLPAGTASLRAVVPGKVLGELSRILPDDETFCNMSINRSRMMVSFGNNVLSTVLLSGDYIDYRRILPADFKAMARCDRSTLQSAIDGASLMAREGKNNVIRMAFSAGSVTVSSHAELGDFSQQLDCDFSGDALNIAFNAKYLMDVIHCVSGDEICMNFNTSVSPCVIKPRDNEDYLYLILPVRVFQ